MHIIFLIIAGIFLLLKTGILPLNLQIQFDLLSLTLNALKCRVRISLVTVFLTAAWFGGLNKVIEQYIVLPTWAVIVIIFMVLPSIYETIFNKKGNKNNENTDE